MCTLFFSCSALIYILLRHESQIHSRFYHSNHYFFLFQPNHSLQETAHISTRSDALSLNLPQVSRGCSTTESKFVVPNPHKVWLWTLYLLNQFFFFHHFFLAFSHDSIFFLLRKLDKREIIGFQATHTKS